MSTDISTSLTSFPNIPVYLRKYYFNETHFYFDTDIMFGKLLFQSPLLGPIRTWR